MNPLQAQLVAAVAIVAGLVTTIIGALVVAFNVPGQSGAAFTLAGGAAGALASALNSPTGVAAAIAEMKKPGAPTDATP